jgi:putative transposase
MKKQGRPAEIFIELTETQRTELRRLARQAIGRVSERVHFVLLSDQGKSVPEIASLFGYSAETVYTWLERYQQAGAEGLVDQPRSGRPKQEPYLTAIVQAQASQSPRCFGYLAACWTVALLAWHLARRFKVSVSTSTVRRALALADFGWGRPKLVLAKRPDPDGPAKLARLEAVLAEPEATLIAADECEMHLLPLLRAMWHRRGQQPKVVTPGQNRKRPIFGGVNLRTGAWHYQLTSRKRGIEFIAFLTEVVQAYPTGPIYVLIDNASIHTSKAVLKWVSSQPRLELIYLPTYMGHKLNPTEKVWWDLKDTIAANYCFKSLAELDQFIQRYFNNITQPDILRLINSAVVRQAQLVQAA